jgi:hypothetical protein
MALTPDRQQQVDTTKKKYGEDHYSKIGSKGGQNTPTQFTSESSQKALKARWDKYRAEQAKKEEGEAK